ncbi:hypothetical protein Q2T40_19510 [Winogradskyella maritima]|uniref:Peptidoglycan biosynthesis/recognition protein n=1 Tax=Winogradskyella maritima TaxID=1517766 RepID=A0ABV8AHI0_9FLAO|nr:hypothetical protein [Winogradskyella maritima]
MSLTAERFTKVDDIPAIYWADLHCTQNSYYSPEFLKAFEVGNNDITFHYIFILKDTTAVAFANTQLVTIGVKTITKNIKIVPWLKRLVNGIFCDNKIRVLFCGNVFLSGEYGTFLKVGEPKVDTFKAIASSIDDLVKSIRVNAIFVKDFENESLCITDELKDFDYASMRVEPNMTIGLKPEWHSFDDYKNALRSKYRVKANKADKDSDALTVKLFNEHDIAEHINALQALYENTIANADFNAQVLDLNTYISLKAQFKERFIIQGYFYENKLVGFLSAMKNQDNLDAHFIGIDYEQNRDLAIYPRILNDYVRLGISLKAERINLGRTASEIKSTLGAQPEELMCYVKHKYKLPNSTLKPFIKNVKIKSFRQHRAFKKL